MTPHPQQEWILPQKRLDELNQYFNNHKDDLIRIAWKNMLDDIHLHLCKTPAPAAPEQPAGLNNGVKDVTSLHLISSPPGRNIIEVGSSVGANCGICDEWDAAVDEMIRIIGFLSNEKSFEKEILEISKRAAFAVKQNQNWLQQHDATIRNQTLADIAHFVDAAYTYNDGTLIEKAPIEALINSLRSTQEPQR